MEVVRNAPQTELRSASRRPASLVVRRLCEVANQNGVTLEPGYYAFVTTTSGETYITGAAYGHSTFRIPNSEVASAGGLAVAGRQIKIINNFTANRIQGAPKNLPYAVRSILSEAPAALSPDTLVIENRIGY